MALREARREDIRRIVEMLADDEVVAELGLADEGWHTEHVGTLKREAISPAGESAVLRDNLIVLRRTP